MTRVTLLGLVALVPAALNGPVAVAAALQIPVCSSAARLQAINLPSLGPARGPSPAGSDQQGCCAKGCRTGARKRKSSPD